MKRVFLTLLLMLGLAAGSTFAQNATAKTGAFAPYVDAGVGVSSTLTGGGTYTAKNPDYSFGLGVESDSNKFLFDINGQFNSANVRTFGSALDEASYKGTVTGLGYVKIKHFLVGGGVRWSDQVTNTQVASVIPSSITELVPLVSAGVEFSRDRVTATYVLPGREAAHKLREGDLHNEIFLTKSGHFRLTQDVTERSSRETVFLPHYRLNGLSAAAGIKFVF